MSPAALLAEHPVFRGLDAAARARLAAEARDLRLPAGAFLFREGEAAETLHLLREGDVAIEIACPGRDALVVETLHPGEVLGWSWLAPDHKAMSDARALSDVRTLALDAARLRALCEAEPAIGYAMFKHWLPHLMARLRAQRLQLLDLYGDAR